MNIVDIEKNTMNQDLKNNRKDYIEYIVSKTIEADKNNKVFQATFSVYSKGYYKEGVKTDHINEETVVAKLTYQKPDNALIEVIDINKDLAKGAKLLYDGSEKVKVKAAGLLGLIPVSFSVYDPMFKNARNHNILDALEGLDRLLNKTSKIEVLGVSEVEEKQMYMLKIIADKKPDPEITHEIIGVDSETFVVLLNEMYIKDDLVSQYMVKDIKTNIQLEDDFFSL